MRNSIVLVGFFVMISALLGGCDSTDNPPSNIEPTSEAKADTVFFNGTIITVDDNNPKAIAVATRGGLITYVGGLAGLQPFIADTTDKIDLKGKTLVPGFVDAHGHVVSAGLQAASANMLAPPDGAVTDFASLIATLEDWQSTDSGR